MASDRLGQASITILRLASDWANCAATVPPVSESTVFPEVCEGSSSPVSPTNSGQATLFVSCFFETDQKMTPGPVVMVSMSVFGGES